MYVSNNLYQFDPQKKEGKNMLTINELKNAKKAAVEYFKAGNKTAAAAVCKGIIANAMEKRAEIGRPFSMAEAEKFAGLHFTTEHTAKMAGMISISTVSGLNSRCEKNARIKGSICEKCFSRAMEKRGMAGKDGQILTMAMLTLCDIPSDLMPTMNAIFARIEAFGDIENVQQVANYNKLILANPLTRFGWWTKNPDIMGEFYEHNEKPENVQMIYSSLMMNKAVNMETIKAMYPFIDKIFTVYESETMAIECGKTVNCGKLHCLTCHKCYIEGVTELTEILK